MEKKVFLANQHGCVNGDLVIICELM